MVRRRSVRILANLAFLLALAVTVPSGAAAASDGTEVVTPSEALQVSEPTFTISGRTQAGSTVTVHVDDDRDGLPDGEPLATAQLSPETSLFELTVQLEEGDNHMMVRSRTPSGAADVVQVPTLTYVRPTQMEHDYWPGLIEVHIVEGADISEVVAETEAAVREPDGDPWHYKRAFPGTADEDPDECSECAHLSRWFYVDVNHGEEDAAMRSFDSDDRVDNVSRVGVAVPAGGTGGEVDPQPTVAATPPPASPEPEPVVSATDDTSTTPQAESLPATGLPTSMFVLALVLLIAGGLARQVRVGRRTP